MKLLAPLLALLGTAQAFSADSDVLMKQAGVGAALQLLRKDDARTLQEQIAITQIPAPPFHEQVRAQDFAGRLRDAGLTDVSTDTEGNVIGKRRGAGRGPLLVLSAHLDTVFEAGTDVTVREREGRYYAPGIADDARGLAALLSVLRAMQQAKLETVGDIWFVGTVGEEALGNLRGVKALFAQYRIDGFISVDGVDSPEDVAAGRPQIVTQATGSRRWEITFTGPGGHSFGNFSTPSATHALARAVARIADLRTPDDPKTTFNVGVIKGGNAVTSIASEASFLLDLRSNSAEELAALELRVQALIDEAVAAENERWDSTAISAQRKLVGDRPASTRNTDSAVADAAVAACRALGLPAPALRFASTDSNVPLGLGIPAATINGGGQGDKAHSADEWYAHNEAWKGPQVILLTTLRLAGLKGVSKPALKKRTP